jgi:hypothetical protein
LWLGLVASLFLFFLMRKEERPPFNRCHLSAEHFFESFLDFLLSETFIEVFGHRWSVSNEKSDRLSTIDQSETSKGNPMSALTRTKDAQASLQQQFDMHECKHRTAN